MMNNRKNLSNHKFHYYKKNPYSDITVQSPLDLQLPPFISSKLILIYDDSKKDDTLTILLRN